MLVNLEPAQRFRAWRSEDLESDDEADEQQQPEYRTAVNQAADEDRAQTHATEKRSGAAAARCDAEQQSGQGEQGDLQRGPSDDRSPR